MNADLLLPDGATLNVDVSFDCGSDYHNTAMMVMSESGAKLLAAAYTHLYGEEYGQKVMDAWNTKAKASDPRKPTYLFAIAPRDQDFKWRDNYSEMVHKRLTRDTLMSFKSESQLNTDTIEPAKSQFIPILASGCGTKIHNPQVAH